MKKSVEEMSDDEIIEAAKTEAFGEAMNERIDSFLSCEAFENRMDPENRCRAFRLAVRLVQIAMQNGVTTRNAR